MGSSLQLVVSVIPQNLDVWAWEKYYKQQDSPISSTRPGVELRTVTPQTPAPSSSTRCGGGGAPARGMPKAMGLVPKTALPPAAAATNSGELARAMPT